jgi:hypothetical protein
MSNRDNDEALEGLAQIRSKLEFTQATLELDPPRLDAAFNETKVRTILKLQKAIKVVNTLAMQLGGPLPPVRH